MHITNLNLVAGLAGLAGRTAPDSAHVAESTANQSQAPVEQSGESNPDRDAQGQGDGMMKKRSGNHPGRSEESLKEPAEAGSTEFKEPAPCLPDEPPSQLDLIG